MQVANAILNQWGPALLICFTVVLGLFYQNSRMNDLGRRIDDVKASLDKRIDNLKGSIDKRFDHMGKRFDDLTDYIKSEFKRVGERMDRLESPIARK
jgi:hypothetical protein